MMIFKKQHLEFVPYAQNSLSILHVLTHLSCTTKLGDSGHLNHLQAAKEETEAHKGEPWPHISLAPEPSLSEPNPMLDTLHPTFLYFAASAITTAVANWARTTSRALR